MKQIALLGAVAMVLACGGGGSAPIAQAPDYDLRIQGSPDPQMLSVGVEYRVYTIQKSTGNPRNGAKITCSADPGGGDISLRDTDGVSGRIDGEVFITCTAPLTGHIWGEADGHQFSITAVKAP